MTKKDNQPENPLESKLIASFTKDTNQTRHNFAKIMSMRNSIKDCLNKGWSMTDIYKVLIEDSTLTNLSYHSFRKVLINQGIYTPKKEKEALSFVTNSKSVEAPVSEDQSQSFEEDPVIEDIKIPGLEPSNHQSTIKPISRFGIANKNK